MNILTTPLAPEHALQCGEVVQRPYGSAVLAPGGHIRMEVTVAKLSPEDLADALGFFRATFVRGRGAVLFLPNASRPTVATLTAVRGGRLEQIPVHSLAILAESSLAQTVAKFVLEVLPDGAGAVRRVFVDRQQALDWLAQRIEQLGSGGPPVQASDPAAPQGR